MILIQSLINGMMLSLIYILIASGLTLVLSVARIINFAHGEFYMLGAFIFYWLGTALELNFWIAMILAIFSCGVLGWVVDAALFSRVRGMFLQPVATAVGLIYIFSGGALLAFGERDQHVKPIVSGMAKILGITIAKERLLVIIVSLAIILGLWYFVTYIKLGKALRAVVSDRDAAAMQGINTDRISHLTMFIGCALAGAAGALISPLFLVNTLIGIPAINRAFLIMLLGGLGSVPGAIVGAMALGFIEAFGYVFIGGWTEFAIFMMLLLVLSIKPSGLFGKQELEV